MLPWLGAVLVDLLASRASSGHWGILYGCQHYLAPTFQNHKKNLEEEERSRNIAIKKCFSFSFLMPYNYGPEASVHSRTSQRPTESNILFKLQKETALSKNGPGNLGLTKKKAAPEFWCKMSPYFVFYQTQLQCKYAYRSPVNEINCNKESFLGSQ